MENLGIDYKLLLAQIINFVVFFLIFKKFIAKPFGDFLTQEERKEKEKEKLDATIKKSEEELAEKEKKMLGKLHHEETELMNKARVEAGEERKELIDKANREASEIVEKAHQKIAEERQSLYKEAKNKVADLSLYLISHGLKEYLSPKAQKDLTDYVLKNLKSTKL